MYVGHVSLVLRQVGRELQVWGACLLPSTTVLLWSPALPPLLHLLLQETFLGPLPLFFPLPVTLSFSVLFPALILLTFRSFGVFAGVNVGPRARVKLLQEEKNYRRQACSPLLKR